VPAEEVPLTGVATAGPPTVSEEQDSLIELAKTGTFLKLMDRCSFYLMLFYGGNRAAILCSQAFLLCNHLFCLKL